MNKWQKELLDKCKEVAFDEEVPLLDDIYILPTNKKHESGYNIMYVIGFSRETKQHYLLDTICDVVNIGEYNQFIRGINVDIEENGVIHFWSNYEKFKSVFKISSCTFEMVDRHPF